MFYTELVKQAADIAGVSDVLEPGVDGTKAQKAFEALRASLLALNSDGRIAFAVDDVVVNASKNRLALTPDADYVAEEGEQAYITDYPVEVPPAYIIGGRTFKFRQVRYEDLITNWMGRKHVYAFSVDYGKAVLHLGMGGELKIGLRKPLDMPEQITDEARLTGSALNLLKYKLATELLAAYGFDSSPGIEQKYAEAIGRHNNFKTAIPAPPALRW